MRHGSLTRRVSLTALLAVSFGVAASLLAGAALGGEPIRMKLDVRDGKTVPPSNPGTELRLRVAGEAQSRPRAVAEPQAGASDAILPLSYCPANAGPRSVVHAACYLGEEPSEPRALTASIRRAAQPMPLRGTLAPPRFRRAAVSAVPDFSAGASR